MNARDFLQDRTAEEAAGVERSADAGRPTARQPRRRAVTSASTSTAQARRQPPARRWTDPPDTLCCGVDEAGRGPLAGPVVAAAVILDPARPIAGLDDSKALTARRREALFDEIVANALAFSIAEATVAEIDTLNILHATMLAMQRAVAGLSMAPGLVRVDGNRCPTLPCASEAVIGGDACVPAISAASILAKVSRDRQLLALDAAFPVYGFGQHAGYGTAQHLAALDRHGPCIHHRRSFAPVRRALGEPCGPTGRGPRRVQTPLDPAWFETMHDVVPRDPFSGKLF